MATPSYGSSAWLGIGEESAWGTAAARSDFIEIVRFSVAPEKEIVNSPVTRRLDPQRSLVVGEKVTGDFSCEIQYEGYLKLFKHLLGSAQTSDVTSGVSYMHEFARADNLPEGLTLEANYGQANTLFTGARINQLQLEFDPTRHVEGVFSILGRSASDNTGSASTPTFPSDHPIHPADGVLLIGGTDYSEHVSKITIATGNSLTADRPRIGSVYKKKAVRSGTRPEVRITLSMEFNSDTKALADAFLAGTLQSFKLTFTDSDNIGASTDKYMFKVECPSCRLMSGWPTVEDPGIEPLNLELVALAADAADFDHDSGQSGAIKITVQNGQSSI